MKSRDRHLKGKFELDSLFFKEQCWKNGLTRQLQALWLNRFRGIVSEKTIKMIFALMMAKNETT